MFTVTDQVREVIKGMRVRDVKTVILADLTDVWGNPIPVSHFRTVASRIAAKKGHKLRTKVNNGVLAIIRVV